MWTRQSSCTARHPIISRATPAPIEGWREATGEMGQCGQGKVAALPAILISRATPNPIGGWREATGEMGQCGLGKVAALPAIL
jgi:hypothetical protein